VEVLKLAGELKLLKLGTIAIDGTRRPSSLPQKEGRPERALADSGYVDRKPLNAFSNAA